MPLDTLRQGDEVAILPAVDSKPCDVLEIARVVYGGKVLVQLEDGRRYNAQGYPVDSDSNGFAVPVTDEHRAAAVSKALSPRE